VVRLVVTGGSLTRKTEKVTLLSPGRGILTNKWENLSVPKPNHISRRKYDKIYWYFTLYEGIVSVLLK